MHINSPYMANATLHDTYMADVFQGLHVYSMS